MRILITGGAGYIGSHTLLELLGQRHEICVLDNFSNSVPEALKRVEELTNGTFETVEGDVCDEKTLNAVFEEFRPEAVVHFAGKKAVAESTRLPITYYEQNLQGTLSVLKAMERVDCKRIVFSSSATVYGEPQYLPYDEIHPCMPTSPYGRTKYFIEEILRDWGHADSQNSAVILRYFNPAGAHASGKLGEDPNDIPNNLMPFVSQVAVGKLPKLQVFGDNYSTRDGTGARDYIHVLDLAQAHVAAVDYSIEHSGVETINIGTGNSTTVLEIVRAFEKAAGRTIPYEIAPRRAGDIDAFYADSTKAKKLLGWSAKYSLDEMCESAWKWQSENPDGYL